MARLAAEPDATLRRLVAELGERGVVTSYGSVWRIVREAGVTFKKEDAVRDRAGRPAVARGRDRWRKYQGRIAPQRLVFVMDNLASHKGKAVRRAIRQAGAKLPFLPPYSPDLNPIEQVFAKLKLLLRKAAERSVEATWRRVGELLVHFPPGECAAHLRNSGCASA